KSTDGGVTWTQLQSTITSFAAGVVKDLEVSPNNSNLLLATSYWDIKRSVDGGVSWTVVHPDSYNCDIEFFDSNPNKVVAGSCGNQAPTMYSDNGGQSWSASSGIPLENRKIDLEFSRSAPGVVYALGG